MLLQNPLPHFHYILSQTIGKQITQTFYRFYLCVCVYLVWFAFLLFSIQPILLRAGSDCRNESAKMLKSVYYETTNKEGKFEREGDPA